jgi:hypothetical protein
MTNSSIIRQEILKQISLIPDEQLSYLLELIHQMTVSNSRQANDNILNDPLANFIGAVDHGNLAQNNEQDLYG